VGDFQLLVEVFLRDNSNFIDSTFFPTALEIVSIILDAIDIVVVSLKL